MNKSLTLLSLAGLVLCSGCASIISDTTYPVVVTSSPEGAQFSVENEDGITVANGTTPQTILLKASNGFFDGETYTIRSSSGTTILDSDLDEWYWGNIIFGGAIGLLIVDPATGAMWELPDSVEIEGGPEDFDSNEESDFYDDEPAPRSGRRAKAVRESDDFWDE